MPSSSSAISSHQGLHAVPNPLRRLPYLQPRGLALSVSAPTRAAPVSCCASRDASTEEQQQFVGWFRQAWPYIRRHSGSTFVVAIAGEIVDGPLLGGVLDDIALLHGLGIRLILVPATHRRIERLLSEKGAQGRCYGRYRVTDEVALQAAMEAAGAVRHVIESRLAAGPPMVPSLRRHGNRRREVEVSVESGNFISAKRRGTIDGIDYGATGEVKKVDATRILERLESNCIVSVSNLGYSSTGQVLNCNSYEVATACALTIDADKLICIIDGQVNDEVGHHVRCMTAQDADLLIRKRVSKINVDEHSVVSVGGEGIHSPRYHDTCDINCTTWSNGTLSEHLTTTFSNGVGFANGNGFWADRGGFSNGDLERLNLGGDYISELAASVFACEGGVQRVHLVDGNIEGALMLELFTRDGVSTMVSCDVSEGTRMANTADYQGVKELICPLQDSCVLVGRKFEELSQLMSSFIVMERDGSIIACAVFLPFYKEMCGEIAAFAISSEFCGTKQGEKLLGYIEKKASFLGLKKLFLLSTSAADWFLERGFAECAKDCIPKESTINIDPLYTSKCYMKPLHL